MTRLAAGVLLFSVAHLVPAAFTAARAALVRHIGEVRYKVLFSLVSAGGLVLMVTGWKFASIEPLYTPPAWGRHAAALLVWAGLVLFPAPYLKSNVHRLLQHPQLTGVMLWGAGHLVANGETRSVFLFGGLTLWALLERIALNRRDGVRQPPDPVSRAADLRLLAVGTTMYVIVLYAHGWLFGVAPFAAAP